MAIYSCNLRSIGRTTHATGTAGAHLRYIGREGAASQTLAAHMPENAQAARTWMDGHEREARKNARLCDKIRLALPRELDEAQRAQLVQDYMHGLTRNRVPWYAAIHQTGKDAHNPHAHIVVVDRDIETGKRVLMLSDSTRDREKKGLPGPAAVEWVRERWEHHANQALERAGHAARIDRRTLEAQGIEREPQIHVGPRAQHIDTQVKRPESKPVPAPTPRMPERVIDYPMIDAGRTRRERNGEIIDLNLERAARSEHFETRVWALFEREQRAKDRPVETQAMAAARRRTLEERRIRRGFAEQERDIRARRDAEARFTRDWLRERHSADAGGLKARHEAGRHELAARHSQLLGRVWAAVDLTGRTKQRRAEERDTLARQQREERQALAVRIRQDRQKQAEAVRARYLAEMEDVKRTRAQKLGVLQLRQDEERAKEDALLQARAAERERQRLAVQKQIEDWKKAQRNREAEAPEKEAKKAPAPPHPAQDWKAQALAKKDAPQPQRDWKQEALARRSDQPSPAQDWKDQAKPQPQQPAQDSAADRAQQLADKWRKQGERQDQDRGRSHERDRGYDRE